MRGHPQRQLCLVIALFLVLGFFVWQVTLPATISYTAVATAPPSVQKPTFHLRLDFVQKPETAELTLLGNSILKGNALTLEQEVSFELPKEGVELVLKVKWPDKTPQTAVRFQCNLNGANISDRTFWAQKELTEIILIR